MTKKILLCLLVLPVTVQGQIYRCDTPAGLVFSDERCGEDASLVIVSDESSGLGGGPPEEVREYLDQKRQERAGLRSEKAQFHPRQPQSDARLLERIRELERQRLQQVAVPGNAAEIVQLQRQIAELKAARDAPEQPVESQVLRFDRGQ